MSEKKYDYTRDGLIEKLQDELDDLLSSSVDEKGNKKAQTEIIRHAAPIINNCREIVFAISEYGDDLDLSEKEYETLIDSEHTLLALNDRFVSSEYHTSDSTQILDFIKSFVKNNNSTAISMYGLDNYESITANIGNIKQNTINDTFIKLSITEVLPSVLKQNGLDVIDDRIIDSNSAVCGYIKEYGVAYPVDAAKQASVNKLKSIIRNTENEVAMYNRSFPFPNLPGNKAVIESGWRIADICNDTVLAVKKMDKHSFMQYVIWDYDRINGGCTNGNYYFAGEDCFNSAMDSFKDRLGISPKTSVYKQEISFNTLKEIAHVLSYDDYLSESACKEIYEKYDQIVRSRSEDYQHYFGAGYPIDAYDAKMLVNAPRCLSTKVYNSEGDIVTAETIANDTNFGEYSYTYHINDNEINNFDSYKMVYGDPISYYFELMDNEEYAENHCLYEAFKYQETNRSVPKRYKTADLDGQQVLYASDRLCQDDFPSFVHIYSLKKDENGRFITVENSVIGEFDGSIITFYPVDFNGNEIYEPKSLSFSSEIKTLAHYVDDELNEQDTPFISNYDGKK